MKILNITISIVLAFLICAFISYLIFQLNVKNVEITALKAKYEVSQKLSNTKNNALSNNAEKQKAIYEQQLYKIKQEYNFLLNKQKREYEELINQKNKEIQIYKLYQQKTGTTVIKTS